MNDQTVNYRKQVLETVEIFARPSMQQEYEANVPIVNVPEELVCDFPFFPKDPEFIDAFLHDELLGIAELYGMVCIAADRIDALGCQSVADMLKVLEWRNVIAFAKDFEVLLNRNY
ncbi:MAG: hypothetical protein QGE95_11725 [Arenicellales bacterium]|jgi:hypothetical protein|nr:hypothetical protein [Pseudomonadales bacterium]MDP7452925.1 hypothetical protein [Arenicellales bacterium]|tara:strand:- start:246 stop:593 length:348 start_codon:yes stop_codon:yes gene_type:complete